MILDLEYPFRSYRFSAWGELIVFPRLMVLEVLQLFFDGLSPPPAMDRVVGRFVVQCWLVYLTVIFSD